MQAKLLKLSKFTTGKDGQPLKTSTGRPYTRIIIQTEEHEKPLSGFENDENRNWKAGDTVEIDVKQNGEYFNFSTPKKEVLQSKQMEQMQQDITKIILRLGGMMNDMRIIKDYVIPHKAKVDEEEKEPFEFEEDK